jgi:hypothetical protein
MDTRLRWSAGDGGDLGSWSTYCCCRTPSQLPGTVGLVPSLILALAPWPNLHQYLNFISPDLHPSYMASVDGTGGGSKSNRETPPTANLWRGGGTVEAAATSGLAEDGKGTLCTMVSPRMDLLEPGPGGKHTARGESRGPGVAS